MIHPPRDTPTSRFPADPVYAHLAQITEAAEEAAGGNRAAEEMEK
jgi:hypothetical protein